MDINSMSDDINIQSPSKKRLTELVQLKLAGSLNEYNLKGKKFKSTLEKASKALAAIIAKQNNKQKKNEG